MCSYPKMFDFSTSDDACSLSGSICVLFLFWFLVKLDDFSTQHCNYTWHLKNYIWKRWEKLDRIDPLKLICYSVDCDLKDDFCMQKHLEAEDLENLSAFSPQDDIIPL